ncbi:hypothetical protein NLI96_g11377 [Meripilus lineatus]|uniref:Uncharacterized protein n=1 Tax=Meripilus lineatus TaxID=2056292 RepID=A0AAD5Y968_9APHY|nr:hypothetical protein NLI96_g11377 [Physisporinus lineatus]
MYPLPFTVVISYTPSGSCVIPKGSIHPNPEPFFLFDDVRPGGSVYVKAPLVLTAFVSKPGLQPGQVRPRDLFPVYDKNGEPWSLVLDGFPQTTWVIRQRSNGALQLCTPDERVCPTSPRPTQSRYLSTGTRSLENSSQFHPPASEVAAPLTFERECPSSSSRTGYQSVMDADSRKTRTHNPYASNGTESEIRSVIPEVFSRVDLRSGRGDVSDQQVTHTNRRESTSADIEPRKRGGVSRFLFGWLRGKRYSRRGVEAN